MTRHKLVALSSMKEFTPNSVKYQNMTFYMCMDDGAGLWLAASLKVLITCEKMAMKQILSLKPPEIRWIIHLSMISHFVVP
jgi:hypothetical protein